VFTLKSITHLIWPHFIRTEWQWVHREATQFAMNVSNQPGQHDLLWSHWLQPQSLNSTLTDIQFRWNEGRWNEMRWDEWYERFFTVVYEVCMNLLFFIKHRVWNVLFYIVLYKIERYKFVLAITKALHSVLVKRLYTQAVAAVSYNVLDFCCLYLLA